MIVATRKRDSEVLDAAARTFAERGYAHSSIREIADAAGLHNGSLYHYIDTKEDLLFRLLEQARNDVKLILDAASRASGLRPLERVELYVRRQVAYILDHPSIVRIYCRDLDRLSPRRRSVIERSEAEHQRWLVEVIREAQARGQVRASADPLTLSRCVFALLASIHRFPIRPEAVAQVAVIDACAALTIRGIVGAG